MPVSQIASDAKIASAMSKLGMTAFPTDDSLVLKAILVALGNTSSGAVTTGTYSTSQVLTAAEVAGSIIYVTGAATITLPPVTAGASVTILTIGNVAVSVKPDAADLIVLDGVALVDGNKATNTSTAGDIAVLTYYDATGWYAATNSWTDGGA